ncbi:WD40/YVTN/BNR-like repeat-containing protein [Paenibacillus sp. EC2-1]|uniref:WD40/YVTN/BNR-like repeat-containing protein n=1 Tax=Paenibacillus sp. EC2-1 TaxID=3388665 RepID=UPI003BEF2789
MLRSKRFVSYGALLMLIMIVFVTGCQKEGTAKEPIEKEPSQGTTSPPVDNPSSPSDDSDSGSTNAGDGDDSAVDIPVNDTKVNMNKVSALRLINHDSGWVGGEGFLARTDNGGKRWIVQMNLQGTVKQIFALNDKEAWAVTEELELYRTQDGGKEWRKIGKAPMEGFLHFTSSDTGFIGHALTQDGGQTWTELNAPDGTVGEVYFHDKSIGWAVSQSNDHSFQLMRTTDGGATWRKTASKETTDPLGDVVIRSMGKQDAWMEVIGGSGMNQTAYSLFHTSDGGNSWTTVVANSTAGGGPAPGYPKGDSDAPKNEGVAPGPLYVVNKNTALMGGFCAPCDKPNTVGRTTDGGKTWENGKQALDGSRGQILAMADENHGWMITLDSEKSAVLYKTTDGGIHWKKSGE